MAKRQLLPERVWVGCGVIVFGLVLVRKAVDTDSLVLMACGASLGLCGALVLLGLIRPPRKSDD